MIGLKIDPDYTASIFAATNSFSKIYASRLSFLKACRYNRKAHPRGSHHREMVLLKVDGHSRIAMRIYLNFSSTMLSGDANIHFYKNYILK